MTEIEWSDISDSVRLDEVLDALDVEIAEVKKGEIWASCPLPTHPGADVEPSFSINEDAKVFHCFVCNEGGLLPSFVAAMLGLEGDDGETAFQKGLEWLLPYSDADLDSDAEFIQQIESYLSRSEERIVRTRTVEMPFFSPRLLERLPYAPLEILEKWNITDEATVEHFNLRYDEERLRVKGDRSYSGPALVIPHFFGGKLVGFQERWLDEDRPKWIPKYTNSDDFPKAQTLYNWDGVLEEARKGLPIIVVESTMTVVRLQELGYSAVATFGASVRDEQVRLLTSLPGGVILAFDSDPDFLNKRGQLVEGAGKKAIRETAEKLVIFIPVMKVSVGRDDKMDLADLDEEQVHRVLSRRVIHFA